MASTSSDNQTIAEGDIASNSFQDIESDIVNKVVPHMEDEFSDANQFLKKIDDMLAPLQEIELESTKPHITNQINEIKISLFKAVENEDMNAVYKALDRNDDLEIKDDSGNTFLHVAAKKGCADLVNLLLERGANIKAKNNEQQIPLHVSCRYGKTNVAKIFLEKGVFIDIEDKFGNTSLHHACDINQGDVVKMLLNQGASYTIKNNVKKTAVELCEREDSIKAFFDFNSNLLSMRQKEILLVKASEMNWQDTIDSLIKSDVNVNCENQNEETPLMAAARKGHDDVINKLLKYGAHVNVKSGFLLKTALHLACENGHLESVKLLLRYHCNNESNLSSFTPIKCALIRDKHHIVEYLLDLKQSHNTNYHMFNEIVRKKTYLKKLLFECSYYNSYKTAELLLNKGVTVDAINDNKTALLIACNFESEQVVNLLLKRGANVNARCLELKTPLHYACNKYFDDDLISKYNIVKLLLLYKADTTCKDKYGQTALDVAKVNNLPPLN